MTEIFVRRHFLEIVTFYKTRLTYQKIGFATTQKARIQTAPTDELHKKTDTSLMCNRLYSELIDQFTIPLSRKCVDDRLFN